MRGIRSIIQVIIAVCLGLWCHSEGYTEIGMQWLMVSFLIGSLKGEL